MIHLLQHKSRYVVAFLMLLSYYYVNDMIKIIVNRPFWGGGGRRSYFKINSNKCYFANVGGCFVGLNGFYIFV